MDFEKAREGGRHPTTYPDGMVVGGEEPPPAKPAAKPAAKPTADANAGTADAAAASDDEE